jgi:integrase
LNFGQITKVKIREFITFLSTYKKSDGTILSANAQKSIICPFKVVMIQAYKDEIITFNPSHAIEIPKTTAKKKQILDIDELRKLFNTECEDDVVKRLSLLAVQTSMRHSDCSSLQWKNVFEGKETYIEYTQQKTNAPVKIDISKETLQLLGTRKQPNDLIFEGVHNSQYCNKIIRNWVKKAGIEKDITFHCFRHTYGSLQVSEGTNLYAVSQLMGHSSTKTTEIYLHLLDKDKKKAANVIKLKPKKK